MRGLKEFFNQHDEGNHKGIVQKNNAIKRSIISYMAANGECTLADLTKQLRISTPTITKLIGELVAEDLVTDNGKVETSGGRRPNVYGLANTAIYFAGVDVCRDSIRFVVTDLENNIIDSALECDFILEDTPESLEHICSTIDKFIGNCSVDNNKILGLGVCIAGRVNHKTGRSYKYFTSNEQSLQELFEQRANVTVLLENDSRARCYAEYNTGNVNDEKNVLYLHLGRGVAVGIVIEGKLFYGKSGFAGEFGHTPFFDNDIICSCGKKGCLETEVSGIALEGKMEELIRQGINTVLHDKFIKNGSIHIDDIIEAAKNDDNLSIELVEEAGEKIGKSIAYLINIFNPELVVVGGNMSQAGDCIMLPIQSATNKYSLNLVYKDTKFRVSKIGEEAGALGAAMLIRSKIIGV